MDKSLEGDNDLEYITLFMVFMIILSMESLFILCSFQLRTSDFNDFFWEMILCFLFVFVNNKIYDNSGDIIFI